jgi:hypothetical protein
MSSHCFAHGVFDGMHCPECHGFERPNTIVAVARTERLKRERAAAIKALVGCASHLTALCRPDLAPYRMDDLIACPRCEGQRYDVGNCGVCENVGWLDDRGLALCVPGEPE